MPITGKQFELGIDNEIAGWMRKIHQFLASHSDEAFTMGEVAEVVEAGKDVIAQAELPFAAFGTSAFQVALVKLMEIGTVDSRSVGKKTYYRVGATPLEL